MKLNTEYITESSRFWKEINTLAREAFPPEEYITPSELVKMAESDNFDFFALTDNNKFVGFAAVYKYDDLAYLFFLAIDEACRSRGYGSVAIKTLKEIYPNKTYVVDFEMPDDSANNCVQRKKRRDFYIRNGYKETGWFLSYLGVDYEVFCMNEIFDIDKFKAMMKTIRIDGFNPIYFQKNENGGNL